MGGTGVRDSVTTEALAGQVGMARAFVCGCSALGARALT
jgi:hypothetical protein